MTTKPEILICDNYDSFTYNLVQALGSLGAGIEVRRNDAIDIEGVSAMAPDAVVISPGPGSPAGAGLALDLVAWCQETRTRLLGVCLGSQCIAEHFGADVVVAEEILHGKTSSVIHDGVGLFEDLPNPFDAMRYHSLVVDPASVRGDLRITARTAGGTVMGIAHARLPIEGVQFHPESFLTGAGMALLANFVGSIGAVRSLAADVDLDGVAPADGGPRCRRLRGDLAPIGQVGREDACRVNL